MICGLCIHVFGCFTCWLLNQTEAIQLRSEHRAGQHEVESLRNTVTQLRAQIDGQLREHERALESVTQANVTRIQSLETALSAKEHEVTSLLNQMQQLRVQLAYSQEENARTERAVHTVHAALSGLSTVQQALEDVARPRAGTRGVGSSPGASFASPPRQTAGGYPTGVYSSPAQGGARPAGTQPQAQRMTGAITQSPAQQQQQQRSAANTPSQARTQQQQNNPRSQVAAGPAALSVQVSPTHSENAGSLRESVVGQSMTPSERALSAQPTPTGLTQQRSQPAGRVSSIKPAGAPTGAGGANAGAASAGNLAPVSSVSIRSAGVPAGGRAPTASVATGAPSRSTAQPAGTSLDIEVDYEEDADVEF